MYPRVSRIKAFTIIEVLVVVAIIGILASMALPAYFSTVQQARRSDAEQALQQFRQAMERHYTKTYSYVGAAEGEAATGSPRIFAKKTPIDGGRGSTGEGYYALAIEFANAVCFEITATPVTGASQEDDRCGTLVLNHTGRRGSALNDGSCWNGTDAYASAEDLCSAPAE